MTELTDTALVPLAPAGGEVALPDELIERAKEYAAEAFSERTREAYSRWWRVFLDWCDRHGRQALPASPATVAAWLASAADGIDTGRPLARSSLNQGLAAITWHHRAASYAFDRKHRAISLTWQGISRTKALTEVERRAAPFLARDVEDLLAMLNTSRPIGARNACLLTLGFGAALRRSELVGLDWEKLGTGFGWVTLDPRGILVTLARSKSSQDAAQQVVIPRADFLPACEALEAWVARAQIEPGQPLLRSVNNRNVISAERLTAHSVSRIVKRAIRDISRKRGKTMAEAADLLRRYSGHSLRAGFVTSAAAVDVPALRIADHSRHRSLEMVQRYVRFAERYSKSALKGVFAPTTGTEAQP
jgi:integrase